MSEHFCLKDIFINKFDLHHNYVLNEFVTGIDRDDARAEERHLMLADAEKWLKSGKIMDEPHPKTGATALHVAAAKGYLDVMV